jgi:hypothetical protein
MSDAMEKFRKDLAALQMRLAEMPEIAEGRVGDAMEAGLLHLAGAAADYPPAPAESTYRRTGTLGRLWTQARPVVAGVQGALVQGRIGNRTPYGPYVQDPAQQAWFHRGRWQTTEDVVRDEAGAVEQLLAQAGAEIVRDLAGGES